MNQNWTRCVYCKHSGKTFEHCADVPSACQISCVDVTSELEGEGNEDVDRMGAYIKYLSINMEYFLMFCDGFMLL
jgi:hypothetical protein